MEEKETASALNPHVGHRDRVKSRFDKEGLDGFSDHNVLELILFYAIPRKDTNETAHALLAEFGSLSAVFDARRSALAKIAGESGARLIKLIMPIAKRYYIDRENYRKTLRTSREIGEYAVNLFVGDEEERLMLLCFDTKMKLINVSVIAEGSVNSCRIDNRLLCETALRCNSSVVALAHNHPGGIALPSRDDVNATMSAKELLKNIDIVLFDHIVVANRDFVSFRDSGMLGRN